MAAKVRSTTGRSQNVLAKENDINQQISREILPKLPSFVVEYNESLDTAGRSVKTRRAYLQDILQFFEYMVSGTGLTEASETKDITLSDIGALKGRDVNAYLSYIKRYEDDNGNVVVNGKDARARKRSSVVGLLKYLYREDLIEHDVTGKIATISVKDSERTVKALEEKK